MSNQLKFANHVRQTTVSPDQKKNKSHSIAQALVFMFVNREGKEVVVRLSSHLSNLMLLNYKTVPVRFLSITLYLLLFAVG